MSFGFKSSGGSGGGGSWTTFGGFYANYSALPAQPSNPNILFYCISSQGTKWLPGSLGGTYYPSGWYFSDGTAYTYQETPFQASQATVDAGLNNDQFVTPLTLTNSAQLAAKAPLRPVVEKVNIVDADEVTGNDSESLFSQIRTTWTNIKAFLKTYFDTFYATFVYVNTQRKLLACGAITQVAVTDYGNGLVDISSIIVNLNNQSDFSGSIDQYTVPALNSLQLIPNQYTYVTAQYNGGSPIYVAITDNNLINHSTILNIVQLYWQNVGAINRLHVFYTGLYGLGLSNKTSHRLIHTQRFGWESGLSLTEYGTRNINISDGRVWYDSQEVDTLSVASATAGQEFDFYYKSGGVWTATSQSQYNNSQFQNGNDLATLSNNKYGVIWFYKSVNNTNRNSFCVLGSGDYTLSQAQSSQPPTLPDIISKTGILVGRIIVLKGDSLATQTDSAFSIAFAGGGGAADATATTKGILKLAGDIAGTADLPTVPALAYKKNYHGVVNPNSITYLVNNGTRTLTVAYNGVPYDVYIGGLKYTVSTDLSVQIGTGLGQHFIIFTVSAGNIVLLSSQVVWDILNTTYTPCATIHWDGATMIPGDELHDYRRNLLEHKSQHDSWGAQYVSGFTNAPTFNVGNTFSFLGGVIRDEERYHSLSGTLTTARVGYRVTGGATMTFDAIGTDFAKLNAGVIRWDNGGTLTDISNNNYGIFWIYATNRKESTALVSLVGQGDYASVAAAQAASLPTLAGVSVAEWKLLYRVICKRSGTSIASIQVDPLYNTSTSPAVNGGSPATISAGNVTFTPYGNISSSNTQSAIQELDDEKATKSSPTFNDVIDNLKKIFLNLAGITSGQTRNIIFPDRDLDLGNITTDAKGISINGNGGIIQVAQYGGYYRFPYACTITGWVIYEGSQTPVSTTSTMDVYKKSSFYPQAADTIFPSVKPNLTAQTNNSSTGLSISVAAGDIITFAVTANNNAAILNLLLTIIKS